MHRTFGPRTMAMGRQDVGLPGVGVRGVLANLQKRAAECCMTVCPGLSKMRTTLERYDVKSCDENLFLCMNCLSHVLLVCLLLAVFFLQNLIFRSTTLRVMDQLRSQYALAPFQTVAQPTAQKSYSTRVKELWSRTRMLQCVSRLNVCSSVP